MDFPRSTVLATRFEYLRRAGSTNDELVRRVTGPDAADWPDLSVLVTGDQTGGRGRLGRAWLAPAGKSLAVSALLRPARPAIAAPGNSAIPIESFAWFPLLAGLAMVRAVDTVVPAGVALKWPNDVLINGLKVCGILSELLPGADGVVVGAGLNLTLDEQDLPTDTSTSLLLAGVEHPDPDAILAAYLRELRLLYRSYLGSAGSATSSGLLAAVTERCETVGRPVRVELPTGKRLTGTATAIDAGGRIVVESDSGLTAVAAGDVTHLRY
ncbi:MAG: biotin--[acetyl-CoA-carboxylase] ligase [Microbacteriaceae bacterium]